MLSLRLQSMMFLFARTVFPVRDPNVQANKQKTKQKGKNKGGYKPPQAVTTNPIVQAKPPQQNLPKDKYSKLHKGGPQLQITKILIKNGTLTSREIYRSYLRNNQQKRNNKQIYIQYFKSLSNLKKTLSYMRANGKISSGGYDRKKKMFLGWKINQKRALSYVHPNVINQLQEFKKKINQL